MNNVAHTLPTLGAGVDYLTCTAKRPHYVAALLALGKDLVAQEEGGGGVKKGWHWQGFSGWQAGSVGYGFNGYGTIVRLSGAAARESAADAIGYADNVSRLDVQITTRTDGIGNAHAQSLYESLAGVRGRRGRPIARSLITTNYGGDSLYIGRRISDQFGRVYNKSAEEKENTDTPRWRYEVEFKRKQALSAARSYVTSSEPDAWCVREVYNWFSVRGIRPPISPVDRVNDRGDARGADSQAKQLEWLKVAVRPVLQRLALVYGWPDVLSLVGVPMAYSERYINETLCRED